MVDPRLSEILHLLAPGAGKRLWFGGATTLGCLRGVSHVIAAWKPAANRHSIWEFTLHVAYWKYAVRRNLCDAPVGGFPRSPANWPDPPERLDETSWKRDRALLRSEHTKLVAAVREFDPKRLDEEASGSEAYRYSDLLTGVVMHDVYHVGQIQLLKRLYRSAISG
jgi:hypothetical protein